MRNIKMKNPYDKIVEQTVSRILLANSWREHRFYGLAQSIIIQAREAVERFQRRLDGLRLGQFEPGSLNLDRLCDEFDLTDAFSERLQLNITNAVKEMEDVATPAKYYCRKVKADIEVKQRNGFGRTFTDCGYYAYCDIGNNNYPCIKDSPKFTKCIAERKARWREE
jgi:hypothetical protein